MKAAYCVARGPSRKNNEDNICFDGEIIQNPNQHLQRKGEKTTCHTALWALADGIGGEKDGEIASFLAVSELSKSVNEINSVLEPSGWNECVFQCVSQANDAIVDRGGGMGSTIAILVMGGQCAQTYNLGDSSIYLMRNSELCLLTTRHTMTEQLVRLGIITPDAAKTDPRRNQLTRYLGMTEEGMVMVPDSTPSINYHPGDIFLLCTDGLTDVLSQEEIAVKLCEKTEPLDMACSLVRAAHDSGGRDNASAIVVVVE